MWRITKWNKSPRHYDFSEAGLAQVDVTAIESEGVELCNGIELCDWESEDDRMQLIVCRTCGIAGCETKGWTTFRRAGGHVFWIPLFSELLAEDDWCADNYSPPTYFRSRGIPCFDEADYLRLQAEFPRLPALRTISLLKVSEAVRCIQHDAPARLLGDIYCGKVAQPRLSMILAATEGDHEEWSQILSSLFEADCEDHSAARIGPPDADDRVLTMFPDIVDFPEWCILWLGVQSGYYLGPNLKLETQGIENKTQHHKSDRAGDWGV